MDAIKYNNILDAATLSRESYRTKTFEACDIEILKEGNTYAFRGTDEFEDVITDLRFFPWYTRGLGFNPSGFVKIAKGVHKEILFRLSPDRFGRLTKNLVLTGHSLGGAIALLVGALLVKRGIRVEHIVTFGSPKVGKLKILKDTQVTMFKNGRDIVTTQPFMFRHPRELIQLGDRSSILHNHSMISYLNEIRYGSKMRVY